MMSLEGQLREQKSIRYLKEHMYDLVCDCIAFANANGGTIFVGIEDGESLPLSTQRISTAQVDAVRKRINELALNLAVTVVKQTASNGGELIALHVNRSNQPASTNDGKFLIRVGDSSKPLRGDELGRFITDRPAFSWEHSLTGYTANSADHAIITRFLTRIRASDRVTAFVKAKSDEEILGHYQFVREGRLTNLGILCIGTAEQRNTLGTAPVVQAIKYDVQENKISKWLWDDYSLPIWELVDSVWGRIPDWQETYEIADGMFRQNVPVYEEIVVRELLVNALVHRPYNQRGDIFLNLHPNHLEFHNPGPLPLGVTPENILHAGIRRNPAMAQVFHDMKLMEREGSGYDKIYETLLANGKELPIPTETHDRVKVTINKRIVDGHIVRFMNEANQAHQLTPREHISLGLLAQHRSLNVMQFTRLLNLFSASELVPWVGSLVSKGLVVTEGQRRSFTYSINPEVFRNLNFTGRTHLGAIPEPRLRQLILEDLRVNQPASFPTIHKRIGSEIAAFRVKNTMEALVAEGVITSSGERRWKRYSLVS